MNTLREEFIDILSKDLSKYRRRIITDELNKEILNELEKYNKIEHSVKVNE